MTAVADEWPQGIVKSCVEDHFDTEQNNAYRPLIRNSCTDPAASAASAEAPAAAATAVPLLLLLLLP